MKKRENTFTRKLIFVCIICFIISIVSMFLTFDYLVNKSGIELDFVKPEAYKDYQG